MTEAAVLECMHACLSAGEVCCLRHFESDLRGKVSIKPDDSPVSVADRETEQAIRSVIEARFPEDEIFGEEMGRSSRQHGPEQRAMWVIDPIDGTRAFLAGFPLFGILIARMDEGGALQASAVSMPALGVRRFFATRTSSTREEDSLARRVRLLRTSGCCSLARALLYVGEAERILANVEQEGVRDLLSRVRSVRYGHDCYLYVRLAAGGLDIVLESGLQPYDFLPLVLLVERAGGVISDWHGAALGMHSEGQVLACASATLHAEALACLRAGLRRTR